MGGSRVGNCYSGVDFGRERGGGGIIMVIEIF